MYDYLDISPFLVLDKSLDDFLSLSSRRLPKLLLLFRGLLLRFRGFSLRFDGLSLCFRGLSLRLRELSLRFLLLGAFKLGFRLFNGLRLRLLRFDGGTL